MPQVTSNGITLEYEVLAPDNEPTVLLVSGLGGQLISWFDEFCDEIVGRGYRVVRFDNRDVGLSTKIDDAGMPDIGRVLSGDASAAPYLLTDMADDAAGLIDALGTGPVHVVGVSMGGMISQQLTISHPDKVASLCSIMSTTGDRAVGQPTPEAMKAIMVAPGETKEEVIEAGMASWRIIGSPGFPFDEDDMRERLERQYDRMHYPMGVARQLAAIVCSPDRTDALGSVDQPTLVIHGDSDVLVTPSGGEATARAVSGAELLMIEGMGHSLPKELYATVADAIEANIARARQGAGMDAGQPAGQGASR